ncbi:zinc-ribbon domain-containing protein [Levilactobacillus namurensis]|uniref:zinc-ribbon domain-containing protein n=1 Tax=Levilactobacillus namurensis TaxID=380393 RepID=UPI0022300FA3|nr:zinc ribbon domain-containing protein [Levilactobacillus namurensis]MCW3778837.1 zinc-ribbon domain-containing protein [Levilactobacillus namurensis]MDT7019411.1 zinc-ribbon domain-containing protein [Levilactobacillus namurensis]WNN65993.1 zinc-ribbon domain-containing protein [Levilactobacillus namurensis]
MKFCPNCGHQLEPDAQFCPACGAQITGERQPGQANQNRAQEKVTAHAQYTQTASQEPSHTEEQPQLGFVGSIQYIMQHVFEFNGDVPESRKSVFWWGYLGVLLLNLAFVAIPYLGTILCWATDILLISANMRRLAYLKKNTGLSWLLMVPVVSLYPLVLMFLDRKD